MRTMEASTGTHHVEDTVGQVIENTTTDPNKHNDACRGSRVRKPVKQMHMDPNVKSYRQFLMTKRKERTKKHVTLPMVRKNAVISKKKRHVYQKALNVVFQQVEQRGAIPGEFYQILAKEGFRRFGKEAVTVMVKEFTQLDQGAFPGKPVVEPADPATILATERKEALEAVNLIKKKRSGVIKGRTCADSSRQRKFLKEGKSVASPMVFLESLIATLVIDAYKGRDVATFDVPGAYLHVEMPQSKWILMRLRGDFMELMCQANPKYRPYVTNVNSKPILYLHVLQAIYGCIESALLWYELFGKKLQSLGFIINPYDRCIANKMFNGKQCMVAWYLDNIKVSHADPEVVTDIINIIQEEYGDVKPVRGSSHTYLGMNIKILDDKRVMVDMRYQIRETILAFGEDVCTNVSSPASRHLMQVNETGQLLSPTKAEAYHSLVAKLLYLEKRARPDIEPTVAFLCTRVSSPDEDNWKKLCRVMCYLNQTVDNVRILGCSDLNSLFTWVDAAYVVHSNMHRWSILHSRSSK